MATDDAADGDEHGIEDGGGVAGDAARLGPPDGTAAPGATATRYDAADLPVVPPSVSRDEVESDGRVGAVAYPYRVYAVEAAVERRFLPPQTVDYVASVDLTRRLVLRADAVPEAGTRRVEDVLVLPAALSAADARARATETVHEWTRRKFALGSPADLSVERTVAAYKLFWLASRPAGDVLVDSVRGTETPYDG